MTRTRPRSGARPVGVKTKEGRRCRAAGVRDVRVRLRQRARGRGQARGRDSDGQKLIAALNQVTVRGANGDERGFNENNHEGVVDDDVYFAASTT